MTLTRDRLAEAESRVQDLNNRMVVLELRRSTEAIYAAHRDDANRLVVSALCKALGVPEAVWGPWLRNVDDAQATEQAFAICRWLRENWAQPESNATKLVSAA